MAKGTKLSESVKGEITALKRVGKSQREMLKALEREAVIGNCLKSPNKYGTRKPTGRPVKLSSQFNRRIVHEVKRKLCQHKKILKSLVDAPCSSTTIKKYLNNVDIKHTKIFHR